MATTKRELREALQRCVTARDYAAGMGEAIEAARAILARPARVVGYVCRYGVDLQCRIVHRGDTPSAWSAAMLDAQQTHGVVRKLVVR